MTIVANCSCTSDYPYSLNKKSPRKWSDQAMTQSGWATVPTYLSSPRYRFHIKELFSNANFSYVRSSVMTLMNKLTRKLLCMMNTTYEFTLLYF